MIEKETERKEDIKTIKQSDRGTGRQRETERQ